MSGETRRTDLVQVLIEKTNGSVQIDDSANAWPAKGAVIVEGVRIPAHFFLGVVGESHRKRDSERRFQNPGQGKPIAAPPGGLALLLGMLPSATADDDPAVVAMDAYQRLGLITRFSMFVPVLAIDAAAAGKFSSHVSTSGEEVFAFPASKFADYLARVVDVGSMESADSHASVIGVDHVRPALAEGSVHIRPKVGMYAAFARLNYKPWFAIAEFVDNAVQSFLTNQEKLGKEPLLVEIELDDEQIRISDRAAGIRWEDFPRAFSPSQPPPDDSGLSEFGLGMKAAACWFAREWSVTTSALGDPLERKILFDVPRITSSNIEHLPIAIRPVPADVHYTVLTLRNLLVQPQGRTIGKIKDHLASIYRVVVEKGLLEIAFTSASKREILTFTRPSLLTAPWFKDPAGPDRTWKRELDIKLPGGRSVTGWAGLLSKGSLGRAGFSVFRRERLIQGSGDETYRPLRIFRNPNTYTYQRLVGELFVDGFDVSHTKDGIHWAELEDDLLAAIHGQLSDPDLPILAQAEGYRVRQAASELPKSFGEEALHGAGAELRSTPGIQHVLQRIAELGSAEVDRIGVDTDQLSVQSPKAKFVGGLQQSYEFELPVGSSSMTVRLELRTDPSLLPWYGYELRKESQPNGLLVWINLAHSFSENFINSDENTLGPLVRLVTALALAEHSAALAGVERASALRHRVNELLLEAFGQRETA